MTGSSGSGRGIWRAVVNTITDRIYVYIYIYTYVYVEFLDYLRASLLLERTVRHEY